MFAGAGQPLLDANQHMVLRTNLVNELQQPCRAVFLQCRFLEGLGREMLRITPASPSANTDRIPPSLPCPEPKKQPGR